MVQFQQSIKAKGLKLLMCLTLMMGSQGTVASQQLVKALSIRRRFAGCYWLRFKSQWNIQRALPPLITASSGGCSCRRNAVTLSLNLSPRVALICKKSIACFSDGHSIDMDNVGDMPCALPPKFRYHWIHSIVQSSSTCSAHWII